MRMTPPTAEGRIEVRPFPGWAFVSDRFTVVDLSAHFNDDNTVARCRTGATTALSPPPSPRCRRVTDLCGVPFLYPTTGAGALSCVYLAGQVVEVAPERYAQLHVLGLTEGGDSRQVLELRYSDGTRGQEVLDPVICTFPWYKDRFEAGFGEVVAAPPPGPSLPAAGTHACNPGQICGRWLRTLQVDERRVLESIRLGWDDNVAMLVFSLTLRSVADPHQGWTTP